MKKTIRMYLLIAAAACMVMVGGPFQQANATPITFGFQGTVDNGGFGAINIGQTVTGSYTFESTTADSNPSDPNRGTYSGAVTAATITVGGNTWTLDSATANQIGVFNDTSFAFASDGYQAFFGASGPLGMGSFGLTLVDHTETAFGSDALPLSLNLSNFSSANWVLDTNIGLAAGRITSMTAPVPEPSTLLLLGSGLTGLGYVRRRLRARKA